MRRNRWTHTALGTALLGATLLLAGCSSSGASESAGAPAIAPDAPADAGVVGGDGSVVLQSEGTDRSVVVTGSMTVTAEDPSAAARDAVAIVERAGGRVDGRSEYAPTPGDAGSATLTLRIPADRLQSVVEELAGLGRADEVSTFSTDITAQVTDLESRIATERAIIDRLTALFAQATSIDDLVALETTIAQHQAELESLEAQQRAVDDQVALSTLSLYLRSEAAAPAHEPLDFWGGLQAGWGGFVAFFSGLLVALGVLLPWLVTAAVVTAAVVALVRWNRRRRAAHGSSPAD